jgi:hypothetical protein
MHRFKVLSSFSIVDYGEMFISTARGRLIPEVTSPFDSDYGFLFVFHLYIPSIFYHLGVIRAFLVAENDGKTFSAANGRVRPEVKSPFDFLIPIWYKSALKIFGNLLLFKSYSSFATCM